MRYGRSKTGGGPFIGVGAADPSSVLGEGKAAGCAWLRAGEGTIGGGSMEEVAFEGTIGSGRRGISSSTCVSMVISLVGTGEARIV